MASLFVVDMTGGLAKIDVQGPSSRDVLPFLVISPSAASPPLVSASALRGGRAPPRRGRARLRALRPIRTRVDVHGALVDRGQDVGTPRRPQGA